MKILILTASLIPERERGIGRDDPCHATATNDVEGTGVEETASEE